MKTYMPNKLALNDERKWFVVDVAGKVLGRQATEIARLLRGKHKTNFTPFLDCGDFVVVVNAEQVQFTGRKASGKIYYTHSGYPGGIRETPAENLLNKHPERVFMLAVRRMLPKGPLGRQMLKKLKIYRGAEHPHLAQQPQLIEL